MGQQRWWWWWTQQQLTGSCLVGGSQGLVFWLVYGVYECRQSNTMHILFSGWPPPQNEKLPHHREKGIERRYRLSIIRMITCMLSPGPKPTVAPFPLLLDCAQICTNHIIIIVSEGICIWIFHLPSTQTDQQQQPGLLRSGRSSTKTEDAASSSSTTIENLSHPNGII